jgi:hypothetical protein
VNWGTFKNMDLNWNEIKGNMKWYEDILEGIQAQYGEYTGRINNMENIVSLLLSRTESLIQERKKSIALEQTMIMLMQKTKKMEQEVRQFRKERMKGKEYMSWK